MVYFFNFSVTVLLLFCSNLTTILGKTVGKLDVNLQISPLNSYIIKSAPSPLPLTLSKWRACCCGCWVFFLGCGGGGGEFCCSLTFFSTKEMDVYVNNSDFSQLGLSKVVDCVRDIRQFTKSNYIRVKLETSYVTSWSSGKHWEQTSAILPVGRKFLAFGSMCVLCGCRWLW